MKRWFILCMVLLLVWGVGCSKDSDASEDEADSDGTTQSETENRFAPENSGLERTLTLNEVASGTVRPDVTHTFLYQGTIGESLRLRNNNLGAMVRVLDPDGEQIAEIISEPTADFVLQKDGIYKILVIGVEGGRFSVSLVQN